MRRWRRSWVKIHPLPAAIQVLGRRKHRSAAPTGPSVARFAVQRVPGYGSGQPCRSADVHEVAARPGVLVQWSHVMGTAAPAAIPGRHLCFHISECVLGWSVERPRLGAERQSARVSLDRALRPRMRMASRRAPVWHSAPARACGRLRPRGASALARCTRARTTPLIRWKRHRRRWMPRAATTTRASSLGSMRAARGPGPPFVVQAPL